MVVVRKWGEAHINRTLKQVSSDTWLIGSFLLHRSTGRSNTATWIDEGENSSYTITKAPKPHPTTSLPNSFHVKLVHEAGDASAVWAIRSSALCKVKYIEERVTPESVTLDYVRAQKPSFDIPTVICHIMEEDRSYLFLGRLPGRTLDEAWPSLDETWRSYYVKAIVDICEEMGQWRGDRLGGVDGQDVPEYYLQARGRNDFGSMHAVCEEIGIDCSSFAFFHLDLGPTNIIVEDDPVTGNLGIIDFEISGFFPKGWIRTKTRLCSGMDLSISATDWRSEVQKALGANGFEDHSGSFMEWLHRQSS
ncbi:hypothetical protein BDV96DRAFT_502404 [Lophiotrema nucula]|uniref:Aminoglycoside phosphotransferase domain-containing protein n=1 Tax=Lophiotrema nucula TaxID=690887 RepID=A0A6A5YS69_9PLEO|nr:hypothetical protein BDV96DRAFT_502404 [Lophiotrema nucula]